MPHRVPESCRRCVQSAAWVSVGGNTLLAVVKWIAGIVSNSHAMIADALHSSVDVVGSIITLVMLKLSARQSSQRFPYGFGKLEDISALAIYIILVGAGAVIILRAVESLMIGHVTSPEPPALAAAALSIAVNVFMYYFISCGARQARSPSLRALGYENLVDALSSTAALIGIFGAMVGYPPFDPIAAICVAAFIIIESLKEIYETAQKLTDAALPVEVRRAIEASVLRAPYVRGILSLKSRHLGAKAHAEIDILVDADVSVESANLIATTVADRVRMEVDEIDSVRVISHPSAGQSVSESRLTALISTITTARAQASGGKETP